LAGHNSAKAYKRYDRSREANNSASMFPTYIEALQLETWVLRDGMVKEDSLEGSDL
jgi:hypothetical protein